MLITLGSLTFHGGILPGATGFTVEDLVGWTGGAGSKRDRTPRAGAHGSHRTPSHRPDRTVTYHGTYRGSSLADVQHMGDVLTGLEGLALPVTVAWEETRWADVEVDRVRFEPSGYETWADYQVELWMPDPFKYGETRDQPVSAGDSVTFGNIAQMSHRGNTAALPKFTVVATTNIGAAGYQLKGKGRTFEVPGPLSTGQVDKVDFTTGLVRRDGAIVTGVIPDAFDVAGGELADWRFWPLSGAGRATPHLTDKFT